ncbi:MAG: hypothetical protein JWO89_3794 [Verrucomicrobiaceae bacterium]|nr:hypothetical protein [Verrucomicrobiaceae bacterium]
MVTDIVIDTSVAAAMIFEDESSDLAEALEPVMLAGGKLVAPALILWELTNALRSAVLSKRITKEKASNSLLKFCALPIEAVETPMLSELPDLLTLAVKHQLTSYDASYLQLAMLHQLPLATHDGPLRTAAVKEKVALFAR